MKVLHSAQEVQLKEIGTQLRQVRQEKSITIDEVAAKTRIRLTLLKALEDGHLQELPEPVFVQGFIRRYADVVGLDGTALARNFPINLLPGPSPSNSNTNNEQLPSAAPRYSSLYVPYILLLVAAVSGLSYLVDKPRTTESVDNENPPLPQQPEAVTRDVNPAPVVTPAAPVQPAITKPSTPIEVSVDLQGNSWMRVIADGKIQYEGILTKGTQQTWTAEKELTVRIGNAGAVLLSFNQQPAKALGNLGDVKQVTFTPEQ